MSHHITSYGAEHLGPYRGLQDKVHLPEEAAGQSIDEGLPEGSEAPVEVMPEPAAPPSYDHLRIVGPHPDLTEAQLDLIAQIRRRGGVERVDRLTERKRLRAGV